MKDSGGVVERSQAPLAEGAEEKTNRKKHLQVIILGGHYYSSIHSFYSLIEGPRQKTHSHHQAKFSQLKHESLLLIDLCKPLSFWLPPSKLLKHQILSYSSPHTIEDIHQSNREVNPKLHHLHLLTPSQNRETKGDNHSDTMIKKKEKNKGTNIYILPFGHHFPHGTRETDSEFSSYLHLHLC